MGELNVLANSEPVTTKACRRAVAQIIRDLQLTHRLTDCDFAEKIGCSVGTVRNARNEETDLSSIWLTRIEQRFGAGSIDPYLALAGSRSVPIDATAASDPLPAMTAAVHRLAVARSPNSPGGARETHGELLDMLPDLKTLQQAVSALVCRIEKMRAAA